MQKVCRALTDVKEKDDSECQQNGDTVEWHMSLIVHSTMLRVGMEVGEQNHLMSFILGSTFQK